MPRQNPERKYVSLMFQASNYYASWDPHRRVRIGDYGHLEQDGSFACHGNIFDNGVAAEFGITATMRCPEEGYRCISAVRNSRTTFSGKLSCGDSVLGGGEFKKSFTISSNVGAILVMRDARHGSLQPTGLLPNLIYSTAFSDTHVLVSELYSTPACARLLAPKQDRSVEISLDGGMHGRIVKGHAGLEWRTNAENGDFQTALCRGTEEEACVHPLFRLVGRRMRGMSFVRRPVLELEPPRWRRVLLRHVVFEDADEPVEIDEGESGYESSDSLAEEC